MHLRLLHQRWFLITLSLLLVGCSVALVMGFRSAHSRHIEIRESFILLQTGGYTNEAAVLYNYLLFNLYKLPNRDLIDDWQRTVMLVDPTANLPNNLIWRYHWTVRREMEKRAAKSIQRARSVAAELSPEWGGRLNAKTNVPPSTNKLTAPQ